MLEFSQESKTSSKDVVVIKLPVLISALLVALLLAVTVLLSLGKEVPNEFIVVFSSLASYLIGVVSHNPLNGGQDNGRTDQTN